jgi:hypothetical protein
MLTGLRRNLEAGGDMSLQNALEAVRPPLANVPQYGTREVRYIELCDSTPYHTLHLTAHPFANWRPHHALVLSNPNTLTQRFLR